VSASLIAVGFVQTAIYLLFVRMIDLYEREPLSVVLAVFLWGFAVATTISGFFNSLAALTISAVASAQTADFVTAVFVAPVVEECAKGVALLIVFFVAYLLRRRGTMQYSGVMDGIVYGSAVGFGFAIAEDILYYSRFGAEVFVMRRIFGGFAHAAFAALTGVGIGLIPWVRGGFLKVLVPVLGLSGAILLHAVFNFTGSLFGPLVYGLMFVVIPAYVVLIIVWLAVERRTIRSELRDEVGRGTISPEEYAILPTYFRRTGYYLALISSGQFLTWRRARKVHRAAVDLAFTKRLSRNRWSASREERAQELRRRINVLRGAASPAGP
jgi:protease PrsW